MLTTKIKSSTFSDLITRIIFTFIFLLTTEKITKPYIILVLVELVFTLNTIFAFTSKTISKLKKPSKKWFFIIFFTTKYTFFIISGITLKQFKLIFSLITKISIIRSNS